MKRNLKWPQLRACGVGNNYNVGKHQELKRCLQRADNLAQIRPSRIKHSTAANESNLETTARHIHAPSSELVSTSTGVNEDGLEHASTTSDADPVGFMDIKQNNFTTVDSKGSDHNDPSLISRPTNPN